MKVHMNCDSYVKSSRLSLKLGKLPSKERAHMFYAYSCAPFPSETDLNNRKTLPSLRKIFLWKQSLTSAQCIIIPIQCLSLVLGPARVKGETFFTRCLCVCVSVCVFVLQSRPNGKSDHFAVSHTASLARCEQHGRDDFPKWPPTWPLFPKWPLEENEIFGF